MTDPHLASRVVDRPTDSDLVTAHLAGAREALPEIYDRFAVPLYEAADATLDDPREAAAVITQVFIVTDQWLGQLHDPDQLMPWLFAVLRNEVALRRAGPGRLAPPAASLDHAPPPGLRDVVLAAVAAAPLTGLAYGFEPDSGFPTPIAKKRFARVAAFALATIAASVLLIACIARFEEGELPHYSAPPSSGSVPSGDAASPIVAGTAPSGGTSEPQSADPAATAVIEGAPTTSPEAIVPGTRAPVARPPVARPSASTTPASTTPGTNQPGTSQPGTDQPGTSTPVGNPPGTNQPGTNQPGTNPPVTRQPNSDTSASRPPVTSTPTGSIPASRAPATTSPAKPPVATAPPAAPVTTRPPSAAPNVTTPPATTAAPSPPPAPATTAAPAPATTAPPAPPTTAAPPTTSPPTTVAPTPGNLALSGSSIDLGSTSTSATLTLTNTGQQPLDWSITAKDSAGPFAVTPTSGQLAPGASAQVQVSVDRSGRPEGRVERQFRVTSSANGGGQLTVSATVESAPVVSLSGPSLAALCPSIAPAPFRATVNDGSDISSVVLSWAGPGESGSAAMTHARRKDWDGWFTGAANGTWTVTATATDDRGNVGSASRSIDVIGCL